MSVKKWVCTGLCVGMLWVAAGAAQANDRQVVERMTSKEMKTLLQREGFPDVSIDQDDDLVVKMNGFRVLVMVRENDYGNIKYRFAVSGSNATLQTTNEWNQRKKFTKSYLDEDGDPVLEMDVELAGGVTLARIRDSIQTFVLSHSAFLREVATR